MNLHLMSPIGFTGYGYTGLNILKAMSEENNIGLTIIGNPNIETQEDAQIIQHCAGLTNIIPYDSICLKIWHQFDLLTRVGNGKYYAFPFFEADKLNDKEVFHLNFADHIIVSSKWAKTILEQNNIRKPISVVELGVDGQIFDSSQYNNKTNNYVFLTIGKWEKRKSHDLIIDCFSKAFNQNDNVELWMVTNNPFLNPEEEKQWTNLVEKSSLRKKIRVFPRIPNHRALAELISYSNCGIYISRAEGWNLELLETMSMNKPVITTNYSAHTEYCTVDNSFLVDIQDTEPAIDNKWFFGTSNWAKIGDEQIDQTIQYMRHCYSNQISSNSGGLETAKRLTWHNTSNSLIKILTT